ERRNYISLSLRPEDPDSTTMRLQPLLLVAALFAAVIPLAPASAQLAAVDPRNGFPAWYKDTNGLSLDLCLTDPVLCLLPGPVTLTNPGAAFTNDYGGTFPDEVF